MFSNRPVSIFIIILTFILGFYFRNFLLTTSIDPKAIGKFLEINLYESLELIIMTFTGIYIVYWISIKNSAIQKRKNLCLQLLEETIVMLGDQKTAIAQYHTSEKSDTNTHGLVFTSFRRLRNKIQHIEELSKDIGKDIFIPQLDEKLKQIKEDFSESYSDEDYSPRANLRDIDGLEKIVDDIRLNIVK